MKRAAERLLQQYASQEHVDFKRTGQFLITPAGLMDLLTSEATAINAIAAKYHIQKVKWLITYIDSDGSQQSAAVNGTTELEAEAEFHTDYGDHKIVLTSKI